MIGYAIPTSVPRDTTSSLHRPRLDVEVGEDEDFTIVATVYDTDLSATPLDVTGATAEWKVFGGEVEPEFTLTGVVTDAAGGVIEVECPRANTVGRSGRYSHALIITFTTGRTAVASGTLNILAVDSGLSRATSVDGFVPDGDGRVQLGDIEARSLNVDDFTTTGAISGTTFSGSSGSFTTVVAGFGGAAPITLTSGIMSVPASQSLSIRVSSAGQTITMGAPGAGLGNAITITPGSGGNTAQTASPNNVTIGNLLTGKFYHATPGTITWSGSTSGGATYNPFRMTGVTHTGISSAAEINLNLVNVAGTDNVNATVGKVIGWRFNHNVAAGANGTRNGLHYYITTTGATTNLDFLTAANFFSTISHSTGGTALSLTGSVGAAFGLNSYAVISSGVTNAREAVSYEADVSVREDTGVFRKIGIQVVADTQDAGPGIALDQAYASVNQLNAFGFKDVYGVGGWPAKFPLRATGITSVMRAYYGSNYVTAPPRAYWGINLIEADIVGRAFASNGFSVDGSGAVQIGTGLIQPVASGINISAPGATGASVTVAAGGTGYTVNDLLYDDDGAGGTYGGVYKVATLSGSAVATVTILKAPFVPGAAPGNPIATTTWQITGQGTGCTLNLTWATGGTVTLGTTALAGALSSPAPVTKTGNFTMAATETSVICNGSGAITVTLPAAASSTGQWRLIKTISAAGVVQSASSNVVPLAGGAAGTAILAAVAGRWARLQSDGTNWIIMAAN